MLIHVHELENGQRLEADLCIVGAGAAGLTIAHELRNTPLRICVLESGGLEQEAATNDLQRGRNVGHTYAPLEQTRSRFFGGSTNCWAGFCRPLDPISWLRLVMRPARRQFRRKEARPPEGHKWVLSVCRHAGHTQAG